MRQLESQVLSQDAAAANRHDSVPRRKLLIVEDDADSRAMLGTALHLEYGYRAVEAEDGAQAVAVALSEQPDLILMDLDLPVMNGIEAMQRLRLQPQTQHIPVVVLSGHLSACDWALQARDAGSAGHLRKPTEPATIQRKIREVLGRDLQDTLGSAG